MESAGVRLSGDLKTSLWLHCRVSVCVVTMAMVVFICKCRIARFLQSTLIISITKCIMCTCMHITYADTIIENAIQVKLLELNFSQPMV